MSLFSEARKLLQRVWVLIHVGNPSHPKGICTLFAAVSGASVSILWPVLAAAAQQQLPHSRCSSCRAKPWRALVFSVHGFPARCVACVQPLLAYPHLRIYSGRLDLTNSTPTRPPDVRAVAPS